MDDDEGAHALPLKDIIKSLRSANVVAYKTEDNNAAQWIRTFDRRRRIMAPTATTAVKRQVLDLYLPESLGAWLTNVPADKPWNDIIAEFR